MKKQILPAPSKKVLCLFLTVFTAILTPQGRAASYTWNTINAGNWSDTSANGWNTSGFPNGAGDAAVFSQAFGGAKTFTLDGDNITLGALTFNNTTGNFPLTLTRSGSQTITFDAFGSGPAFLKWAGAPNVDQTHTAINVPITLNDDLVAIGVTALDLVGNITGTGKKISVYSAPAGPAQLRFLGDNTALTGGIVVNVNSAVQFNSLKAMGGGGSGNVVHHITVENCTFLNHNASQQTDAISTKVGPVPVAFIVSIFNRAVNIYEVHNSGLLYNLGFILGLTVSLGGSGGGAAAARRRRYRD